MSMWSWSYAAGAGVVAAALVAFVPPLNRLFRRVWIPSSERALHTAEQQMLDPAFVNVPVRHSYVTLRDGLRIHTLITTPPTPPPARSDDERSNISATTATAADAKSTPGAATAAVAIRVHAVASRDNPKPALVLLHGFGGGVGLWVKNFAALSEHYTVYALDVPGFGRSLPERFTDPTLIDADADHVLRYAAAEATSATATAADGSDANSKKQKKKRKGFASPGEAREYFVGALEEWRQRMGLESFALLGHSLGGYIAADYALRHGTHLTRLILCSSFGFVEYNPTPLPPSGPASTAASASAAAHASPNAAAGDAKSAASKALPPSLLRGKLPWWIRGLLDVARRVGPMTLVRAFGPAGPHLIRPRAAYDIGRYDFPDRRVAGYVYHLIAMCYDGSDAFVALSRGIGYAAEPLLERIAELRRYGVPVTLIYGEKDLMTPASGVAIQERLQRIANADDGDAPPLEADLHVIEGAAHHPYATHAADFHKAVFHAMHAKPTKPRNHPSTGNGHTNGHTGSTSGSGSRGSAKGKSD